MRSQKAFFSILSSSLMLGVTMLTGLILPRAIIGIYGSEVNGLVSSINQFAGYITLMEGGLGAVVHAALYKPLAEKNQNAVSSIVVASRRFFRTISILFIFYLLALALLYPSLIQSSFDGVFTSSLVLIIGISVFFQYTIGMPYQLLLEADQRKYMTDLVQIVTLAVNAIAAIVLIFAGAGIHVVMLASSLLFVIRPIFLKWYVDKKYNLSKEAKPAKEALSQRWDGLSHHIAFMIHSNTDVMLISLFAPIREVSVYTIYYMIIASIRNIAMLSSQGLEAAFGNMLAKKENDSLRENFQAIELLMFFLTTVLFTSAAILIVPFVALYTRGVTDADYIRPLFAYIMLAAQAAYCLRTPYTIVVRAAGHFRQTRNIAFQEAAINLGLSLLLIVPFGLVGVAVGTAASMLFRMIRFVHYLSSEILPNLITSFLKKVTIFSAGSFLTVAAVYFYSVEPDTYLEWTGYAISVTVTSLVIVSALSWVFYAKDVKRIYEIVKRVLPGRQKKAEKST